MVISNQEEPCARKSKIAAFGANGVECCGPATIVGHAMHAETVRTPGMRARRLPNLNYENRMRRNRKFPNEPKNSGE